MQETETKILRPGHHPMIHGKCQGSEGKALQGPPTVQEMQSLSFPRRAHLHCAQAGLSPENGLAQGRQAGT